MAPPEIDAGGFSADILEFLSLLAKFKVRYVIVGGEAVIYHGHPRLTGDIDFFYENRTDNIERLYDALGEFWNGNIPGIRTKEELAEAGVIFQFGRPPNRIDLMNAIDGVTFREAWDSRISILLKKEDTAIPVMYIGLEPLLKNKKTSARPRDLDDYEFLREQNRQK